MKYQESAFNVIYKEVIKQKLISNEGLSINVFTFFAFLGVLLAVIFNDGALYDSEHGLYGPASVAIWSYLTTAVSLICVFFLKLILKSDTEGRSPFSVINRNNVTSIMTIFIIFWILSINFKHFTKINMKKVPSHYFMYSGWNAFLILIQSFFIFFNFYGEQINKSSNPQMNNILHKMILLNTIIIFLSFVLILIQQIILDNFSVDVL